MLLQMRQSFADEVTLHGFLKASSGDVHDGSSAIHDLVTVDCFFQRIKINQIIGFKKKKKKAETSPKTQHMLVLLVTSH